MAWLLRDGRGHPWRALLLECQSDYDPGPELRWARYQVLLERALRLHNVRQARAASAVGLSCRGSPLACVVAHVCVRSRHVSGRDLPTRPHAVYPRLRRSRTAAE